jgi:exosortase
MVNESSQRVPMNVAYAGVWPLLVFVAAALGTWQTTALAYAAWTQPGRYSHGLLVLLMQFASIYLVASQPLPVRTQVEQRTDNLAGSALAVFFTAVWVVARIWDVRSVGLLCAPAIAWGVAIALGGRTLGWRLVLPASLVVYGLPIWEPLSLLLQSLAIIVIGGGLKLVGLPAVMEGAMVFLPAGTLEIAEGCSGVSFFIPAMAVGTYIAATDRSMATMAKARTIAVFAVLGVAANWLRIFILALIAYVTEMRAAVISDHYWFGWLVFAAMLLPAIYISSPAGAVLGRSVGELARPRRAGLVVSCAVIIIAPQAANAVLSSMAK